MSRMTELDLDCPLCGETTIVVQGHYEEGERRTMTYPGSAPHFTDLSVKEKSCDCEVDADVLQRDIEERFEQEAIDMQEDTREHDDYD